MRQIRLLVFVFLAAISILSTAAIGLAQEATSATLPEPEYMNRFYAVGADGKLVTLEVQQPRAETKVKNRFITNSVNSAAAVPNAASSVRLPATVHFVIKGDTNGMDPATLIRIAQLTPGKNERTLPQSTAKATMFGGAKGGTAEDTLIPFTVKKYGTQSYEVIPTNPIPPGEYALYGNGHQLVELDCFGVDAK